MEHYCNFQIYSSYSQTIHCKNVKKRHVSTPLKFEMIREVHMMKLIQKLGHAKILQQNLVVLARMYFSLPSR